MKASDYVRTDRLERSVEKANVWLQRLEDVIAERPEMAWALALASGVLVGWLLKRR